jgi:hypothetical protein
MDKFINKQGFMVEIFDNEQEAEQAGEIGDAILAARSLRLTEIAVEMSGKTDACYKIVNECDTEGVDRIYAHTGEAIAGSCVEIIAPVCWIHPSGQSTRNLPARTCVVLTDEL